ncbi:MAG: flagellar hook capping protein [Desulfobulbus propionicus]|nr:MAG: flagellar hook capping protein [Desulfobulbus propionicus]
MTDISSISQQTSSTSTAQAHGTSTNTLGQEDFLTLLVAQLQNQDPLNPADATEFTSQLAQYSELEQLFNLNDSMDGLAAAQNNAQRISALSLIGKEVLAEGSEFRYQGEPVELGYSVEGVVTDAEVIVKDQFGTTVTTLSALDTSEGTHFLTWDGKDHSGEEVEPGTYTLVIEATTDGDATGTTVSPLVRGTVTEVDLNGLEPLLVTVSGAYSINEVHGAYQGSGNATYTAMSEDDEAGGEKTPEDAFSAATDGAGIIENVVDALQESSV